MKSGSEIVAELAALVVRERNSAFAAGLLAAGIDPFSPSAKKRDGTCAGHSPVLDAHTNVPSRVDVADRKKEAAAIIKCGGFDVIADRDAIVVVEGQYAVITVRTDGRKETGLVRHFDTGAHGKKNVGTGLGKSKRSYAREVA